MQGGIAFEKKPLGSINFLCTNSENAIAALILRSHVRIVLLQFLQLLELS
jgi:hypothetical protein